MKKAPAYRFAAFAILVLPYILIYAGIQIISSLGSGIMAAYGIGEGSLSLLSSIGTLAKALISLLGGALAARLGGKKVVIAGLIIMTLCGFLYLLGPSTFLLLCLVRIFHGCGCGITGACILSLIAGWFPRHERGIAQGCLGGFFGLSISLVTVYSYTCSAAGMRWNETIGMMLAVGGAVMAVLTAVLFKDLRSVYGVSVIDEVIEGSSECSTSATEGKPFREDRPECWSEALRHPGFWITCVTLFLYGSSSLGVGFIMPLFLDECGFNAGEVTSIMSLGTASSIIFAVLGGVISDRFFSSRRCECTIIAFAGSAVFYLLIFLFADRLPAAAVTALYFSAYGSLHIAAGPAWVLPVEVVAPGFASRSMGVCQMFSSFGGFLLTNVFGILTQSLNAGAGMLGLTAITGLVAVGAAVLMRKYHY